MLKKRERIAWSEVIFSEIYGRISKEMEKKMNLYNLYYQYLIMLHMMVILILPTILALLYGCYGIYCVGLLSFNIFVVIYILIIWPTKLWNHGWFIITPQYLIITIGDGKKVIKKWAVKDVNKIVIDLRKKAVEIHLKDKIIRLKRDRTTLKTRFLGYDQSKRFKKAMERTGIKYEVVYY